MTTPRFDRSPLRRRVTLAVGAWTLALALSAAGARAQMPNGDFTSGTAVNSTNTVINNSTNPLTDWALIGPTSPFACVVTTPDPVAGTGSTPGATPMCGSSHLSGGNSLVAEMTQAPPTSGAGALPASYTGNILAADAASASNFQAGVSQTIGGLLAGKTYELTFYYSGVQESGFTGSTTGNWQVAYGPTSGTTTVNTASISIPAPVQPVWAEQQISFTTTTTNEFISFLASGPGSGQPPFMLLADVSLQLFNVPEPASLTLFGAGLLTLAGARVRRRRRLKTA